MKWHILTSSPLPEKHHLRRCTHEAQRCAWVASSAILVYLFMAGARASSRHDGICPVCMNCCKGHLRSHKVIFIFEIKLSLILLPKKNIYSKLSKNVNILKSLLNFLWTNFDLVFLSFKFYVKILKIIIDYEMWRPNYV